MACASLFDAGELSFFGDLAALADRRAFLAYLAPWRKREWVVYAKRPFAGPEQVLAYLARYTHRVAIGNSRLVELTEDHVAFRWKDYRAKGRAKHKVMRLAGRRVHAPFPDARAAGRLPSHPPLRPLRQRPSGREPCALPRAACRGRRYRRCRSGKPARADQNPQAPPTPQRCPCCGGRMAIIESFESASVRARPDREVSTAHDAGAVAIVTIATRATLSARTASAPASSRFRAIDGETTFVGVHCRRTCAARAPSCLSLPADGSSVLTPPARRRPRRRLKSP